MFMSTSGGYLLTGIYVGIPPATVVHVPSAESSSVTTTTEEGECSPKKAKVGEATDTFSFL